MKKEANYKIEAGRSFHADAVTIMHSPTRVMLDFKVTTARLDQVGKEQQQTFVVEHNAIILEPALAKQLIALLKENVEKFEEQHGKVKIPRKRRAGAEKKIQPGKESAYIG